MSLFLPSGEKRKLNMYPLNYEGFLWAAGDTVTVS